MTYNLLVCLISSAFICRSMKVVKIKKKKKKMHDKVCPNLRLPVYVQLILKYNAHKIILDLKFCT